MHTADAITNLDNHPRHAWPQGAPLIYTLVLSHRHSTLAPFYCKNSANPRVISLRHCPTFLTCPTNAPASAALHTAAAVITQKCAHAPTCTRLLTRLRVERKNLHFFAKNTSKWFDKMILDDILCLVLRLLSSSGRAERLIKNQKKLKIPFDKTNFYVILYLTLFWCSSAAEKQVLIKNLKNLQKFAWQVK